MPVMLPGHRSKAAVRERLGWERRCLRDMVSAGGTLTYAFPGFMGAACERLVAKGLATRETLGSPPRPEWWTHGIKAWRTRVGVENRYTITDAGRELAPAA